MPLSDANTSPVPSVARPSPLLEAALLFTLVVHLLAMLSMLLLLPGIPGGTNAAVADRASHLAAHPWLWRIGWFPWQLAALSDLLVGVALLRTPWIPRLPALVACVLTLLAIIPDQAAQCGWTWAGVSLAREAVRSGTTDAYLAYETRTFVLTAGWGAIGYTLAAVAWTLCLAPTAIWSRFLTALSIVTWAIFAAATAFAFAPGSVRHTPSIARAVSIGNAVAFVLLMVWFVCVTEAAMKLARPYTDHGAHARWRHPARGVLPRICDLAANSRLARMACRLLPAAPMASDITDVVYANYLVPSASVERFVPSPLQLQRLGPDGRYALFTHLTYRHGNFGPLLFGPLRRLWPSPIQANWRLYVQDPRTGRRGVLFLTTAITSTPHALATRLLADGVPMHVPFSADLMRASDGTIRLRIDPGGGTAPDVLATLAPAAAQTLTPPWSLCFASWRNLLEYCVPQDRALCVATPGGRVIRQEIALSIPLESCHPLSGMVTSDAARAIAGDAQPLCFVVDRVAFRFGGQVIEP